MRPAGEERVISEEMTEECMKYSDGGSERDMGYAMFLVKVAMMTSNRQMADPPARTRDCLSTP